MRVPFLLSQSTTLFVAAPHISSLPKQKIILMARDLFSFFPQLGQGRVFNQPLCQENQPQSSIRVHLWSCFFTFAKKFLLTFRWQNVLTELDLCPLSRTTYHKKFSPKTTLGQNIVAGIFFAKAKVLGLILDNLSRR